MSNVLKKLHLMNISYTKLNDWSVYFEYEKGKVRMVNTHLDNMADISYDMVDSNSNFIFADVKFSMPTSKDDCVEHILDIYVRDKSNPVVRVKTTSYDIAGNNKVIVFYDSDKNNYIIINRQGELLRLDRNNQDILKGREGELAAHTYGIDSIAIVIEKDAGKVNSGRVGLKSSKIIALIDAELNIKSYKE